MYGYVYETVNTVNGNRYIGQHKAQEFDEKYYGSGILIRYAIQLYGVEKFTCRILDWCETFEETNRIEKQRIRECREKYPGKCYNISDGGSGVIGYSHTQATKDLISECSRNRKFINNGLVNKFIKVDELDSYLSCGWVVGALLSEAGRQHMSEAFRQIGYQNKNTRIVSKDGKSYRIPQEDFEEYLLMGYLPSFHWANAKFWVTRNGVDELVDAATCAAMLLDGWQEGRSTTGIRPQVKDLWKQKLSESNKGRELTPEHIEKIRQAKLGTTCSAETKKKISDSVKKQIASVSDEELQRRLEKSRVTRSISGYTHSEETRKKLSESQKGCNNSMYGKHPEKAVVYNGTQYKTISIKNVDKYLQQGFWRIDKKWLSQEANNLK